MSDHTIKIEDEVILTYICTIDGAPDVDTLLQKVIDGAYSQWKEMYKVAGDRSFLQEIVQSRDEIKAAIRVTLDEAKLAAQSPLVEEILP